VFREGARSDFATSHARRAGESIDPDAFASVYANPGQDATFRWLDSMLAVRVHPPFGHRGRPVVDFLRGDPRYKTWEARLPWRK